MKAKISEPKPRKLGRLYQAYEWWFSLMEMRKRSTLRISAVERGASNLDAEFERAMSTTIHLDESVDVARETMIEIAAETCGPVWDWATGIRGLGSGGLVAQLLARIDDPGKFGVISKLWKFCGWAPNTEYGKGSRRPFDSRLKGICWNIGDSFIKQQTPVYVDIYYEAKEKLRKAHPVATCTVCGSIAVPTGKGRVWKCTHCGQGAAGFKLRYTDAHIDKMARRKMIKVFLSDLWIVWRQLLGLPVSQPYAQAILGHSDVTQPFDG